MNPTLTKNMKHVKWNTATPTLFITTDREENVPSNCKVIKQEL